MQDQWLLYIIYIPEEVLSPHIVSFSSLGFWQQRVYSNKTVFTLFGEMVFELWWFQNVYQLGLQREL